MVEQRDTKYQNVVDTLCGRILAGEYAPATRLPAWSQLGSEFGVGMATVQRAVDALTDDGFLWTRPRGGTFVVDHPPHLYSYALVIPAREQWSRLFTAIRTSIGLVDTKGIVRFSEYFTSSEVGHREGVRRLCDDVCRYRIGGLIFCGSFDGIEGTPVMEQQGVLRVRIQDGPSSNLPVIRMDMLGSFITRSVEYLRSRGRKRIAHLRLASDRIEHQRFMDALSSAGVETRPYWIQPIYGHTNGVETAANVVSLLMQLEGDKRPDALIIHDDNLVEHAGAGLIACGARIPDDLDVVAHCNYPLSAPSTLPMKRLGFDCRMFLRACVEVIGAGRKGMTMPQMTKLPAVFEDELEPKISVI